MRIMPERNALKCYACALAAALLLLAAPAPSGAATPVTTDSRIKTFVYNPNEVFTITTHYGYQSNIEFGAKETIETVSVGDRIAWQIIPSGRRLFIRATEENAHTNMTIVTNLRAYQFDLRSSGADAVFGSAELTYVVRFFYPDDALSGAPMPLSFTPAAMPAPVLPATPVAAVTQPAPVVPSVAAPRGGINYRYTYSGPSVAAPVKIYDDGHTTYFKFRDAVIPRVAVLSADGAPVDVAVRRTADGLVAVDAVASRFSLTQPAGQVVVYNEATSGAL